MLLRSCLSLEVFSVAYIRCVLWQYDMLLIKCISPPMFPAECVVLSVQRDNLSMDNLCVVPVYSGTTYLWRPSRGAATCPVPSPWLLAGCCTLVLAFLYSGAGLGEKELELELSVFCLHINNRNVNNK